VKQISTSDGSLLELSDPAPAPVLEMAKRSRRSTSPTARSSSSSNGGADRAPCSTLASTVTMALIAAEE
jgi:hypothetical protein